MGDVARTRRQKEKVSRASHVRVKYHHASKRHVALCKASTLLHLRSQGSILFLCIFPPLNKKNYLFIYLSNLKYFQKN